MSYQDDFGYGYDEPQEEQLVRDPRVYEEEFLGMCMMSLNVISWADSNGLTAAHFSTPVNAAIWTDVRQGLYDSTGIDATAVASRIAPRLIAMGAGANDEDVLTRLRYMTTQFQTVSGLEQVVSTIKTEASRRQVTAAINDLQILSRDPTADPMDLANKMSELGLGISAGSMKIDPLSFIDLGREAYYSALEAKAARDSGAPLGVLTDLRAIDDYTMGIQPGELMFMASAPGIGKSSVAWTMALNFAKRQVKLPEDVRVGTFIDSLEMTRKPNAQRFAQMVAGIDGQRMRSGDISDYDLDTLVRAFKAQGELPIWMDTPVSMTASQLRAYIAEMVRRHNVGFVIIDHFRRFTLDKPTGNPNIDDETKVLFLEEQIAKSLNVAVLVIAHTRKTTDAMGPRRPTMDDLRGSGTISSSADHICMLHHPYSHKIEAGEMVTDQERDTLEAIWVKNRHGRKGIREFSMNAAKMAITSFA